MSAKHGKSINIQKLIILGLYNEQRGRDSTGYYFSGNIQKGVGLQSDFKDFIVENKLTPGNLKCKVFMGHTRKGTSGGNTVENAHPHVVNNNYVQTHNGVIKDIWPLCAKYGINHEGVFVDSIGLARLIEANGPKPILDEYKGTAALAFTWMAKPEALYLYHGESRETKNGVPIPERPLYILFQPEGLYYSSMREPLDVISTTDDKVLMLKHNAVYEVINGEFTGNKLVIEREDNNIPAVCSSPARHQLPAATQQSLPIHSNDNDLILKEPEYTLTSKDVDHIIYYKGKYHKVIKGHNILGAVTTHPIHGEYVIRRDGLILEKNLIEDSREHKYYFVSGVMVRSKEAYLDFLQRGILGHTEETFKQLSWKSSYPIIQLKTHHGGGKNVWLRCGKLVRKDTFSPKFSNRSYTIRAGITKAIQ